MFFFLIRDAQLSKPTTVCIGCAVVLVGCGCFQTSKEAIKGENVRKGVSSRGEAIRIESIICKSRRIRGYSEDLEEGRNPSGRRLASCHSRNKSGMQAKLVSAVNAVFALQRLIR